MLFGSVAAAAWENTAPMQKSLAIIVLLLSLTELARTVLGDDWPTYHRDARRSGISAETLRLPLQPVWTHRAAHPPRPAWPESPAIQNVLGRIPRLSPTTTYDRAFHVAVAGRHLYYGSSADDTVYCLDLATGKVQWSFTTEGPVRLAPTVADGRAYVGSDDGHVYCLAADTGALLWKHRAGPMDKRLPGNGRMISLWPVRSGIVVEDDVVTFCAGLFPSKGAYLCALAAGNGKRIWKRQIDASPQGYLLASRTNLFVPTGRTAPIAFDRCSGKPLGSLGNLGGCFALLLDDMLAYGPSEDGQLHISAPASREKILSTPGLRMVAKGDRVYVLKQNALCALDRSTYVETGRQIAQLRAKKNKTEDDKERLKALERQQRPSRKWQVACSCPYALIMAGDTLFAGGENQVVAHGADDGRQRWVGAVSGKAYGLAVASRRLFVSTDQGAIHCFRPGTKPIPPTAASDRPAKPSASPYPKDRWTPLFDVTADGIIERCPADTGYCLILGVAGGRLAYEIAQRTRFRIVGVEPDAKRVARARERLGKAGLLGTRIAIHHRGMEKLPYPDRFANLVISGKTVVSGRSKPPPATEVLRVLRPCGGVVLFTHRSADVLRKWGDGILPEWTIERHKDAYWGIARRGPLPGAGTWTHAYADAANTACSGDQRIGGPMDLQWFGQPGPRRMVDRHFRNVPPLYSAGRLFVPGDRIVYALDAYNGTMLWRVDVPNARRLGAFLEAGSMMVDDASLYVASAESCHRFDVQTGERREPYALPQGVKAEPREWGYVARSAELLLGSGRRKGASYDTITREAEVDTHPVWYPNMKLALSESVFGMDRGSGRTRWTYASGRVIETTLTVGGGRLYFVETHSPKALANTSGRLPMLDIIDEGDQFLVALDLKTGHVAYKNKIDMRQLQQPVYLLYACDILLLSGSKIVGGEAIRASGTAALAQRTGGESIHYTCYAFDAPTGKPRWSVTHKTDLAVRGGHGEYNRHPTVVGETVYVWPYAYHVKTGERIAGWRFPKRRRGCGGVSASARCLFLRDSNPVMISLQPDARMTRLTRITRPGCWINIIPAGGLVLVPEASAGCTCGYPIQTSMAFAPRSAPPE